MGTGRPESAVCVVRTIWDRFEARDWAAARALMADELVVELPATGERRQVDRRSGRQRSRWVLSGPRDRRRKESF